MGTNRNKKRPSSDPIDFRFIAASIKKILKAKKITYKSLATQVGRSESGIKKILSAKDCSLNRLGELCGALEISLSDLIQSTDQNELSDVQFTLKQQQYFITHMDCFHFFWKLVFERISVQEIESQFKLTAKESFHYLRKLDELNLIRLNPGGHLRIPRLRTVRTFGDGPLIRKIYSEWSKKLIDEIAEPGDFGDRQFIFRGVRLTKTSFQTFMDSLRELERDLVKTSIREMSLNQKDLVYVSWISGVAMKSFVGRI